MQTLVSPHCTIITWTRDLISFISADGKGVKSIGLPQNALVGSLFFEKVEKGGCSEKPVLLVVAKNKLGIDKCANYIYTLQLDFLWETVEISSCPKWKLLHSLLGKEGNSFYALPGSDYCVFSTTESLHNSPDYNTVRIYNIHTGNFIRRQSICTANCPGKNQKYSIVAGPFCQALDKGRFTIQYSYKTDDFTFPYDCPPLICDVLADTCYFDEPPLLSSPEKEKTPFLKHVMREDWDSAVTWHCTSDNTLQVRKLENSNQKTLLGLKVEGLHTTLAVGPVNIFVYTLFPGDDLRPITCSAATYDATKNTVNLGPGHKLGLYTNPNSAVFLNDNTVFTSDYSNDGVLQSIDTAQVLWTFSLFGNRNWQGSFAVDAPPQTLSLYHKYLDECCNNLLPAVLIAIIADYSVVKAKPTLR